ncbi:YihA family ribosome biogenesis GTP-binding protein [bacterium]|nr:YihA family ribosome biogenesis GTP-binding protein [bacterium]
MIKFIKSANYVDDYYLDDRNQICFIGRSNAGKSSLINSLANNLIAKTSSTPGRTRLVNFFDFENFVLVDLPGFGYASGSKKSREDLEKIIYEYLLYAKKLVCICQLCSIDVITESDKEIFVNISNLAKRYNIKHFIILTKADKLKPSKINEHLKKVSNFFKFSLDNIIPISNKTNLNIKKLSGILKAVVTQNN